jgi:ankyrin repeat protein
MGFTALLFVSVLACMFGLLVCAYTCGKYRKLTRCTVLPTRNAQAAVGTVAFGGKLCRHPVYTIHQAAYHGDINTVHLILQRRDNYAETKNMKGDTPLHRACKGGGLDVVSVLCASAPTTIMCKNFKGNLPLHIACYGKRQGTNAGGHRSCNIEVVKLLLCSWGDSILEPNAYGSTPFHRACNGG